MAFVGTAAVVRSPMLAPTAQDASLCADSCAQVYIGAKYALHKDAAPKQQLE